MDAQQKIDQNALLWSMVFRQNLISAKRIPSEKASQEEQNGANFSSVASSSDELLVRKEISLPSPPPSYREEQRAEHERRLQQEVEGLKARTALELDQLKAQTREMYERESR